VNAPEHVSAKAIESAKAFLSGVYMGLRTLEIHDPTNRAVENAVRATFEAASALFGTTGGFKIQFVDKSVFVNGKRVTFDASMSDAMRSLESALRSKRVGGFMISAAPSIDAMRTLVLQLSSKSESETTTADLPAIGALGLQSFTDDLPDAVPSELVAVQSYGKLILALREQFRRVRREKNEGRSSVPRFRAVRIMQDLVEVLDERSDLLVRLAVEGSGLPAEELHGVNTAVLSLAMGDALEIDRRDLVDLGMAALFHHIGRASQDDPIDRDAVDASAARMFTDGGVSRSSLLRATVVAHQRRRFDGRAPYREGPPHPFARIIAVASAYSGLVLLGAAPIEVLRAMHEDGTGRFDPDLVDLLIDVLRAFPVGKSKKDDMDELFKEFLAGEKKKPRRDTSYSSRSSGERE
jgi:hypothetical protein